MRRQILHVLFPLSGFAAQNITLPAGTVEVHEEIRLPPGARDVEVRGAPEGTLLRAAPDFRGRAIIVVAGGVNVRLRGFRIDGNREALSRPAGLPPYDQPFARFYSGNGILAEGVGNLQIEDVRFEQIAGFAVLVSRSNGVRIERAEVADSGSRNAQGRNNTTGGILLEEGTFRFSVTRSSFRNILGNGVWTHSLYTSPRNEVGEIWENRFDTIGRDAIQVGHAARVRVTANRGVRIGFPTEAVDAEGGGTPVAIDTAGNVDSSVYADNVFEEVNGKCIDLDGFHHGEVSGNVCRNRGRPEDYPFGHFGIVMNNTNPDMQSVGITIARNEIEGMKFGGIFVIGAGHRITGNRLLRLNTAHCNENAAKFGCAHFAGEPDLLQAGIYLGRRAERPAATRANVIEANVITGWKMDRRCVAAAPGVKMEENRVRGNQCRHAAD